MPQNDHFHIVDIPCISYLIIVLVGVEVVMVVGMGW